MKSDKDFHKLVCERDSYNCYMKLQIDLRPISINAFWGRRGNRTYVSKKGEEWRQYIQYHLIKHKPTLDRFKVTYEFHFKGKRKLDTTNYIKPLEDTLTGFIWEDDEQCDEVIARRFYNATHDHVIIEICKLETTKNGIA